MAWWLRELLALDRAWALDPETIPVLLNLLLGLLLAPPGVGVRPPPSSGSPEQDLHD